MMGVDGLVCLLIYWTVLERVEGENIPWGWHGVV